MDNGEVTHSHLIIGIIYILISLFGILGNLVCFVTIYTQRNIRDNPTYFFIANQCLSDVLCLLAIGIYVGVVEFWPRLSDYSNLHRLMSCCLITGWYSSGYFSLILAVTRLYALKYRHLYLEVFSQNRQLWLASFVWLFMILLMLIFETGDQVDDVFRDLYTLGILKSTFRGLVVFCFNFLHDLVVSNSVLIINLVTGIFVRSSLKKTPTTVLRRRTRTNQLELKLYFQCTITTSFLIIICYVYLSVFFVDYENLSNILFLIFHICWLLYHAVCPYVYLFTNGDLKNMMVKVLCHQNDPQNV
uniref:G-protein coupled receptors family 1 profile domain-containing protein n=1 Tax=Romanomermis culicivorax TaxID=13658 RepID=A0A915HHY0_ROMCU